MNVKIFDRNEASNPLNGSIIRDSRRLAEILHGVKDRKPFFYELVGENGFNLLVGVAASYGCVQYSRDDGEPPYLMAVLNNAVADERYKEFLFANTLTPVPARCCMPLGTIVEIATFFQETGRASPDVLWEEV
jgi:Immunity protein Imm1